MKGKDKCKILKEIRKEIAANNDIEFVTSECKHQGECKGTCPKCEAEVKYLERELAKKRNLGKAVAIAGVSAACMATMTGCTLEDVVDTGREIVDTVLDALSPGTCVQPGGDDIVLDGDIAYFPDDIDDVDDIDDIEDIYIEDLTGEVAPDDLFYIE